MKYIITAALLCLIAPLLLSGEDIIVFGRAGGDGELVYPQQVFEGPDSNIYVYDQSDGFIKVYSPAGAFLKKFGGKGQGPGEVQRLDGFSFGFTPDRQIFFTEYFGGHRWITLLETSGRLTKTVLLEKKEVFGILNSAAVEGGQFLVEFHSSGLPERTKDYFLYRSPRELVVVDDRGSIISKIKRADPVTRISFREDGADSPIPFVPMFAWTPFKSTTVLFSDGLSPKLKVYDLQGTLVREIPTPLPEPKKVTDKDLDLWREQRKEMMSTRASDKEWYMRFGTVIEKYRKSIYAKKPNIDSLALTPAGNILISSGGDGPNSGTTYWLLDENGTLLKKMKSDAFAITLATNFLFYKTIDEDENIQVYGLKRKENEPGDLSKIEKK